MLFSHNMLLLSFLLSNAKCYCILGFTKQSWHNFISFFCGLALAVVFFVDYCFFLVTMTSSVFSFNALDELLASSGSGLANATLPASRSSGTAAETPSGESASVSLIGMSPGNKTFSLWFSGAPGSFRLGAIGSSKCCVKPVTNGTRCSVILHQTKKFSPETALGCLLDTEVRAFCAPCFNTSMLSPSQVLWLQGVQFTVPVWEDLFLQLSNHSVPKWLSFEEPTAGSLQQPPQHPLTAASLPPLLLSPTAHEQSGGILALVPSLSFNDSVDSLQRLIGL
jgi:hypothetical protein